MEFTDYANYQPKNAERPRITLRGVNWGRLLSMTAYAGGIVGVVMLVIDWLR